MAMHEAGHRGGVPRLHHLHGKRCRTAGKTTLTPVPVEGPFDKMGMDILKLPRSGRKFNYVLCFIDYLTKWVEVYPLRDQMALTVARVIAEKFIPTHRAMKELLSDQGGSFLSTLAEELY